MLVAAAVLPTPPLLVPSLASGAAPELGELRGRCRAAVASVTSGGTDVTFVVGGDGRPRARSFAPWGVAETLDVPEPMALALLVGAWLTAGAERSFVIVDDDMDPLSCAELGAELAASAQRVGLLVMGDGSARHSEKAPGYLDPRAAGYDDEVAKALAAADTDALLRLDPALARDLLVSGRASWQVLAGAAAGRGWTVTSSMDVPYGVAYHVAAWT